MLSGILAGCGHDAAKPRGAVTPIQEVACPSPPVADSAGLVREAEVFADTLSPAQRTALTLPFTRANAIQWSNLPVPAVPRVGVRMGDLNAAQTGAVLRLLNSTMTRCGMHMMDEIRLADDYIKPIIPMFGWSSGNFYVAFLGKPSATTAWMLKVGGHHLAYNFTFNGKLPGATPLFFGIEPIKFSVDGVEHEPMLVQSTAMAALATAISKHPLAHLNGTFTDVVKGVEVTFVPNAPPIGGNDTGFPIQYPTDAADRGVPYSELSAPDQQLVRQAVESYTALPGKSLTAALLKAYESPPALAETFVGYSGAANLSANESYVRIDGPRLWIEFVVQPGVAYPKQMHYHALWRDKQADYGGEFAQ